MSSMQPVSRRHLLVGVSAAAGGGMVLAACGGSKTKTAATSAAAPTSAAPASTQASTATSAPGATTAAKTTAAKTTAASAGTVLAALSAVPVGGAVSATGKGDAKLLVCQPTAGKVVAFSAICTHMGCTVAPGKTSLDCPCHGSKYDLATGKVLAGPAPRPLPSVAVVLEGKNVVER